MTEPAARADMDPVFEARCNDLRDQAAAEAAARRKGEPVPWLRPAGWEGDVFDYEAMGAPFSRARANEWMVAALDPEAPGVSGDLVSCQTQIETLACLERAFRDRHTLRRPRAIAHMLARKRGHGDARGLFTQNAIEYVRMINKQAREPA